MIKNKENYRLENINTPYKSRRATFLVLAMVSFIFLLSCFAFLFFGNGTTIVKEFISKDNISNFQDISNRVYIDELRNKDLIQLSNNKFGESLLYKSYNSSTKEILIEDKDYNPIIKMKLTSPYTVSGLIASPDTKVAEFYLEDWKSGTNLIDTINFYDIKNDYKPTNKNFRFKYGIDYEECNVSKECFNSTSWIRFESLDELPHKNIKISLWANTKVSEKIEWVPTIKGFEILQWAQWDVGTAVYVQNFSLGFDPGGLFFKTDGTKMYVIKIDTDDLNEYTLSTAWNVSTASYVQALDVSSQETFPSGLFFKTDGTKMYHTGRDFDNVNEYTLSTAWDVSSASYIQAFSVGSEEATPRGVEFKTDGTKMYVVGNTADNVNEYNLTSAWDVSSAVFNQLFSMTNEDATPLDVRFKTDGTKMYVAGLTGNKVYEYNLTSAWDVSTAVYSQETGTINPNFIFFKPDGTKMYVSRSDLDTVDEYNLPYLDVINPNVTINTPLSQSYATTTITFNITTVDDVLVDSCWYTINSGVTNYTLTNSTDVDDYTHTNSTMAEGSHTANFYCNDSSNNVNDSESVAFSIVLGVTTELISPINAYNSSLNNIEFTVNSTPLEINLTNVTLYIWNDNNSIYHTNLTTLSGNVTVQTEWNITVIPDGNYIWNALTKGTGNKEDWNTNRTFTINTTPDIHFISPTPTTNTNISITSFIANVSLTERYFKNLTFNLYNSSGLYDSTTFTDSTRQINWSGLPDGIYTYNATIETTTSQSNSTATRTIAIDTTAPTVNITSPTDFINYHLINTNLTFNWTVSDSYSSIDSCWYNYGGTNTTITCTDLNVSVLISNYSDRTFNFYANDSLGNIGNDSVTWDYKIFVKNQTYNSTSYETSTESFIINISSDGSQTITADLIYDGVNKGAGTKVGNNLEMTFSKTMDVPSITSNTNKTFFWNVTYGSTIISTTETNQTLTKITFGLCNPTLNVPYINFTFKNETVNEEEVSATISSSWNYWLGSGKYTQSLSFSNSTENMNYSFCFSPGDKILKTNYTINYNNAVSQQRTLTSTSILTNVTTEIVLYLLPTSLGLFSPFQVIDSLGNPLNLVKGLITRTLGGSTITITSANTDGSGFVTYFLNPDVTYTALFTFPGYADNTFSFAPTTDLRTVTMGGGVAIVSNGTQISQNTTYEMKPLNSSLNNNTDYTFSFEVTSSQTITLISMNITNSTGGQIGFQSNAGTGIISEVINTGNNTRIVGYYVIKTTDETLSFTQIWIVGEEYSGDYSLFRQLTLYLDYGFKDFLRFLMVFVIILGVLIFMSSGEITDTSESKIIVALLLVWAFSYIGWLDTGIVVTTANDEVNKLGQFSNQFGIAILSTAASFFFIGRRIFI